MTVVVTWYRKRFDEIWCASDSRISGGGGVFTDSGPKILPITITTHKLVTEGVWQPNFNFSIGFAYAGNSLSAVSTHALGAACVQNLSSLDENATPPSIDAIATVFAKIGEHYIRDISSRMVGSTTDLTRFFFCAHMFGFCPSTNCYKAFALIPEINANGLVVNKIELNLGVGSSGDGVTIFPLGSGSKKIVEIMESGRLAGKQISVIEALNEMLDREPVPDVGGYFQLGVADRNGFGLRPIFNLDGGALDKHITFLGFKITDIGSVDNYSVGYKAFSPTVVEKERGQN